MYNITIQQIETFLSLAKHKNLSETANSMFLSQPAVSRTLHRFEEGVGIPLFHRSNNGLNLTKEGEYLRSLLDPLYKNLNRAIYMTKTMSGVSEQVLRIAEPSSFDFSENWIPAFDLLEKFRDTYPDISLQETIYDLQELKNAIEFGGADIVISRDFDVQQLPNVCYKRISDFSFYLVLSIDHPLASVDKINYRQLEGDIFYREVYSAPDDTIEEGYKFCEELGFTPKGITLVPNFLTLYHVLKTNKGFSICSKFRSNGDTDKLRYHSIPQLNKRHYTTIAWKNDKLTQEARAFLDLIPAQVHRTDPL